MEKTGVEVIVAGEAHPMFVQPGETFRDLRDRALRETEHTQRDPDDWELRNQVGVEILDMLDQPADRLAKKGWPRLYLQLRAGGGS